MQLPDTRRTRIAHQQTVKPKIIPIPHRPTNTNIRRNPTNNQIPHPLHIQQQPEVRVPKRALPGLVDHRLALDRVHLADKIVARLAPHQQPPQRARVADAAAGRREAPAALPLAGRQGREVRAVALARVVDWEAEGAEGGEEGLDLGDDGACCRDGVALGGEVAAFFADCLFISSLVSHTLW